MPVYLWMVHFTGNRSVRGHFKRLVIRMLMSLYLYNNRVLYPLYPLSLPLTFSRTSYFLVHHFYVTRVENIPSPLIITCMLVHFLLFFSNYAS